MYKERLMELQEAVRWTEMDQVRKCGFEEEGTFGEVHQGGDGLLADGKESVQRKLQEAGM